VKHEDDNLDNIQESFLEAQEKSHDWLGNEKNEQKYSARNNIRDPHLDHAAGDYEPLTADSRFRSSEDERRTTGKPNKEPGFSQKKLDRIIAENGRLDDVQTISNPLDLD